MAISEVTTVNATLDLLNELLECDRDAITKLMETRVPTEHLGGHPIFQCSLADEGGEQTVLAGPIGLLNAVFGNSDETGWGIIMAYFNKEGKLTHFDRTPDKYLKKDTKAS